MAKTDLKLVSTDSGTGAKITTSITYVNESASSATLRNYAQMLNALTNNNYAQADRVQTINVDTEEVPGTESKPTPTITLTPSTLAKSKVSTGDATFSISWTGDYSGTPYILCGKTTNITPSQASNVIFSTDVESQSDNQPDKCAIYCSNINNATLPVTLKAAVMIPETENYAAATADVIITNS